MKSVKQTVYEMLTENTGIHMLDSGGSNGRMWQRNQGKTLEDFENEPEEKYHFSTNDGTIHRTVSVFHYLCGLDTDHICEEFNEISTSSDNRDGELYGVSSQAWDYLTKNFDVDVIDTVNTYNYDCDLSQIIQYSSIRIDGESYYVVQVHGGADVRGGYTDARLFKAKEFQGGIHEYLSEYMWSDELYNDVLNGNITELFDYSTEKLLPLQDVLSNLNKR